VFAQLGLMGDFLHYTKSTKKQKQTTETWRTMEEKGWHGIAVGRALPQPSPLPAEGLLPFSD